MQEKVDWLVAHWSEIGVVVSVIALAIGGIKGAQGSHGPSRRPHPQDNRVIISLDAVHRIGAHQLDAPGPRSGRASCANGDEERLQIR